MIENTWLIILGVILIIIELLFGAISGFDIAFFGLSLFFSGIIHYFSASWQLAVMVLVVTMLTYFVYFRKTSRKKLLVACQKIGIDTLVGKAAIVINPISRNRPGKVLLDGEVWIGQSTSSHKEKDEVLVVKVQDSILMVVKLTLP